jgi:hypothetical protein
MNEHTWEGVGVAVIDVLLEDNITGIQIIDWLMENRSDVYRIIQTALPLSDDDISKAHEHFQKPFKPELLLEAIYRGLGK